MDDVRPSPSSSSPNPNALATIAKLAEIEKISVDKLNSLVRQGKLPVYKLPNVRAACVKVGEARAILATLTAQGKIRRGYGSFGPDAIVRDLSNVAELDFEVLQ